MSPSSAKYNAESPPEEIHLRRLTVDEALFRLDRYLNDAFVAGLRLRVSF